MPIKLKLPPISEFLRPSKKTVLLIVASASVTIVISTLTAIWLSRITNMKIPSLGTVITLGVEAYWDRDLENKTQTIDWGTILPGSLNNVTLYLRSVSNIETTLLLNATNWDPVGVSEYMDLSWDYDETTVVHPGEIIQVTLTLSASSSSSFIQYLIVNDVKQFSFDIDIRTQELGS